MGISWSRPAATEVECVASQSDCTKPWKPIAPLRSREMPAASPQAPVRHTATDEAESRWVSCWLRAKCLVTAITPAPCTPCTYAGTSCDPRYGSSPLKYSKLRPLRATRCTLTEGPVMHRGCGLCIGLERHALRTEDGVGALAHELGAEGRGELPHELRVPAGTEREQRGPAGDGAHELGPVGAEAARGVHHVERRHAQPRNGRDVADIVPAGRAAGGQGECTELRPRTRVGLCGGCARRARQA
eukprot:scaffold21225_cov55-Phaeocystis_antarctica.AAC.5